MKKKIFKIIVVFLAILLISFILVESLIIIYGIKKSTNKVDYVVVLGARLYGDIPSPALLERLKVAKEYLIKNNDMKVVVSGGQGSDEYIPEAKAMEKYLVKNGVEKERIIVEDKSTSTFENLKLSLDIIGTTDDNEDLKILLVTNRFHVFRSRFLANRLGVTAYGLPAKTPPTIIVSSYIREYFAFIKSFFFDKV